MNSYQQKEDYKVSREDINIILEILEKTSYQKIQYMGYADKDLVVALKDKYQVSLGDYFDRTDKSAAFWCEGKTEDGLYILDGTPIKLNIPKWAEDIPVMIEGIPEHDVLIVDLPLEWKLYPEDYYHKPAEIVFLLGDADSSNLSTSYTWSHEGIWIGRNVKFQKEKELFEEKIDKAHNAIRDAEAIIITAGAGMGVDSGLPDFRGNEGFWKAYPPIAKLRYDFTQMANPALFTYNPKLAWGFYGHRLSLYRSTIPHRGFSLLLDLVNQTELVEDNYFIFTSNVDGQFQKAGFDKNKIYEVHGSIHHLQCTQPCSESIWENRLEDIEIDMDKLEAQILPSCKNCKELARPNILMFGDGKFLNNRADEQNARFHNWRFKNKDKKIVIIEIGAGSAIPTIRSFGDRLSALEKNTTLIRINPREFEVKNEGDIGISLGGLEGIEEVLKSQSKENKKNSEH
ncbi:MAG: Sir2 family NAD-dependent protein deacetylase [Sulfurimonas sp.]|nr:Sir2 family NAD-dependent protein deacetylase [Sulfurimonas sp.]